MRMTSITVDERKRQVANEDQLFTLIEQEAKKSFLVAAWPTDMIQQQIASISIQLHDAEWRFSTQGGVESLFNQASSALTEPTVRTLQAHDWTESHDHPFSASARFFAAVAELLRQSVFEQNLESSVNAMMPVHPLLDELALGQYLNEL